MKYADFEFGNRELKFFDESKVELKKFTPPGQKKEIRFFRKKGFNQYDPKGKIISRSGLSSFREPFEIEPWNQILIDEANNYGSKIDKNKEEALKGIISGNEVLLETKMSVGKMFLKQGFIWVGRSQMICHPDSIIYGEIDEIWYHKETDTYYIGDTKTSSSVDKLVYWYQLAIYIEIMRKLNPNKKISHIGKIDWVKIKNEKWVYNRDFNEKLWKEWIGKEVSEKDEVYRARWNEKISIPEEKINLIVQRDLEKEGILKLAQLDIDLLLRYNISSIQDFEEQIKINKTFLLENKKNQKIYDQISERIKANV
ncbi:MAG: hypothetical protein TYPL_4970 [Candidatus Tyloplasma litorale]|nr:MAG: hypothetical protein TYPL_4970 [Mycoplasmatales bacterium]